MYLSITKLEPVQHAFTCSQLAFGMPSSGIFRYASYTARLSASVTSSQCSLNIFLSSFQEAGACAPALGLLIVGLVDDNINLHAFQRADPLTIDSLRANLFPRARLGRVGTACVRLEVGNLCEAALYTEGRRPERVNHLQKLDPGQLDLPLNDGQHAEGGIALQFVKSLQHLRLGEGTHLNGAPANDARNEDIVGLGNVGHIVARAIDGQDVRQGLAKGNKPTALVLNLNANRHEYSPFLNVSKVLIKSYVQLI